MATYKKAGLDQLNGLHGELANYFTGILQGGDVPPAVVGHIIKFLKDNEITADLLESKPMSSLIQQFLTDSDSYTSELLRAEFS
jgi:hypothetical protein